MHPPESLETPVDKHDIPKVTIHAKPMPFVWRIGILAAICLIGIAAFIFRDLIGLRGQSVAGIIFFVGIVAAFSSNLRAVSWKTIMWGMILQAVFAVLVLKVDAVRHGFQAMGNAVSAFMDFSDAGAQFVFGALSDPVKLEKAFGPGNAIIFAFKVLPPILFISAFFTVLYHFGVLQLIVRGMALVMTYLMRTSGAETLSVAANVFMGQTEAPLIIKPYVPSMTNSELFVLMVSGMAHISGSLMVVYIVFGASPVAVLTAVVMACPASMYLAKLYLPEVSTPITGGGVPFKKEPSPYVNAIDAAATGTTLGLQLALNVGAMLIVFVAFVAMFDAALGALHYPLGWFGVVGNGKEQMLNISGSPTSGTYVISYTDPSKQVSQTSPLAYDASPDAVQTALRALPGLKDVAVKTTGDAPNVTHTVSFTGVESEQVAPLAITNTFNEGSISDRMNSPNWLKDLSLGKLFGWIFSPLAFLMGVAVKDAGHVGNLLGFKLSINEFYAFLQMKDWKAIPNFMTERSYVLTAFALTGFANFSSVGIQLGGIGSIAPNRRADLARLGLRALFVGFTTSLLNASIAGAFLPT